MLQKLNITDINSDTFVINNRESAIQVASLLMNKLQIVKSDTQNGKDASQSLEQLKQIVFCVYFSAEKEYTNILHQVVSYILIHIL